MIRPSRNGSPSPTRASACPTTWTLASTAQDAAALRREPAPAGGALRAGRPARARHRPGRAGPGQGAQLQQSQRRQRRARARRRVPRRTADRRHRQARQPVRRRHARHACSTRGTRRSPATASRRSAGSSRPTARSTPRPPRRSPRSSPKSSSRPTPTTTPRAIFAKKKNLRLLLTGELPDPARGGQTLAVDRRRPAGPGPRQRHASRATSSRCVTKRQPTDAGARRLPVRLDRRQARQVERHRLCQGRRHRRHRRGPDEPPRQRADRRG